MVRWVQQISCKWMRGPQKISGYHPVWRKAVSSIKRSSSFSERKKAGPKNSLMVNSQFMDFFFFRVWGILKFAVHVTNSNFCSKKMLNFSASSDDLIFLPCGPPFSISLFLSLNLFDINHIEWL